MRAALVVLLSFGISAQVRAQGAEDEARALFEQANTAREAGDWRAARDLLTRSLETFPRFPTAWNLVLANERLDDLPAAEQLLTNIRDGSVGELTASQRRSVVARLDTLSSRLCTLHVALPDSVRELEVDGVGRRSVDEPGRARLRLVPGNHEVAMTLPNGARVERSVELEAGDTVRLRLRAPPPSGRLIVEAADPTTTVLIEGVARGTGRLVLSLPPDEYRVRAVTWDELRTVRLRAGITERVFFDEPTAWWQSPWLWTAVGLVVAAAVLVPVLYVNTRPPNPQPADFVVPPL